MIFVVCRGRMVGLYFLDAAQGVEQIAHPGPLDAAFLVDLRERNWRAASDVTLEKLFFGGKCLVIGAVHILALFVGVVLTISPNLQTCGHEHIAKYPMQCMNTIMIYRIPDSVESQVFRPLRDLKSRDLKRA